MKQFFKTEKRRIIIAIVLFIAVFAGSFLLYRINGRKEEASALVTVEAGQYTGQGIVYEWQENRGYILTAGHILSGLLEGESCEVVFSDGTKVQAVIIYQSETADAAFLYAENAETKEIKPVKTDRERFDALKEGDFLYTLYQKDGKVKRTEGVLLYPWVYLEDFSLNMMLADMDCIMGMSGSGVYDEKGNFAGIVCGVSSDGEAAVLPLSVIESEWSMAR